MREIFVVFNIEIRRSEMNLIDVELREELFKFGPRVWFVRDIF